MSKQGAVLAETSFPAYAIQVIGDRHLIICGGGGQAKTGVQNRMELFYLNVNHGNNQLRMQKTLSFDTDSLAVMNADSATLHLSNPILAEDAECPILLATGQDRFCKLYALDWSIVYPGRTGGEKVERLKDGGDSGDSEELPVLGFSVRLLRNLQTDSHPKAPGQRVVTMAPDGTFFITGGFDGHFRVWNFPSCKKLLDHNAHRAEIDDIALSPDCAKFLTLGRDGKAFVWSVDDASKIADVPNPPPGVPEKHRFRAAKFVSIGRQGFLFFTASVPTARVGKKEQSFLTQWILLHSVPKNAEKPDPVRPIKTAPVPGETISCLAVSDLGYLLAIGTMGGSVQIWDSRELQVLVAFKETHAIFVTRLTFLPSRPKLDSKLACWSADNRCGVISISADQKVKLHVIPKTASRGLCATMFCISLTVTLCAGLLSFFEI